MSKSLNERTLLLLIIGFLCVYTTGLFVHVMNIDAALYAELAREMLRSGDWLHLHLGGADYLDKPPLHFWLAAGSFKLFGVHDWSYKLPSFLFFLLASRSVFKIGELLYDRSTGLLASLFFVSTFCAMLMTMDVRTDTIMVGCLSFSIWQLLAYIRNKKFGNLILLSVGIGAGLLAKGPMGLIFPLVVVGAHQLYKRDLRFLLDWKWLVSLTIIALLLLPMCIGLYEQFDLHPEKVVNGNTHVSGLRFYFWTQSFGRITGESDWGTKYNNGASPFFFTHTFLWSFAPWSLFVIGGLIDSISTLIKNKFKQHALKEIISSIGFLLIFVILSASKYRLPHYLYVTFPMASIVAARFYLDRVHSNWKPILTKSIKLLHGFILIIFPVVNVFTLFYFFPDQSIVLKIFILAGLVAAFLFYIFNKDTFHRSITGLCIGALFCFLLIETCFYPSLLKYDASTEAGLSLFKQRDPAVPVQVCGEIPDKSFNFYAQTEEAFESFSISDLDSMKFQGKKLYLYVDQERFDELAHTKASILRKEEFYFYPVQFISLPFLLPEQRPQRLKKRYLLLVQGGK